jgi:RimJ/RimL family protein N-acetyltransferase
MTDLASPRLRVRDAQPDDLPDLLHAYLSNPAYVAQNEGSQGQLGYYDLEMLQRDWQVQRMLGAVMLGIYLRSTGAAVGMAGYLPEHEDGYPWLGSLVIRADHQRQGLGTEAFARLAEHFRADLGWRALRLSVVEQNAAARAFFARLGFRPVREAANSTSLRAFILERDL